MMGEAEVIEAHRIRSRTNSVGVAPDLDMDHGFVKGFNLLNYEETVKQLDIYYGIGI
jgi:hypothetical protein